MSVDKQVDPFTLEIIKESLIALGDEMFITMQRTSMSTIIYEVLDYATGIMDAEGNLITQGNGVTGFIGALTFAVRTVIEKHSSSIQPGDIMILNDPYSGGGTHLSDVTIVKPMFWQGQLVGFAANKAHWSEVGGMAPGSWTSNSTDVWQEGLQFPNIKLYDADQPNNAILEMIRANVRTPDRSLGDLNAQIASVRIAERRFADIIERYSLETVNAAIEHLMDYGERLTLNALSEIPNGFYEAVDYIDDDGLGNGPFEIRVTVTISDDQFVCDFTGSSEQVPGPVNAGLTATESAVRVIFKGLSSPSIPANEGAFRPLKVICPEGSIGNARRPAPTSTYWETKNHFADLVWRALAPVLPDRLTMGHFLSVCGTVVSGIHPDTGELFILVEPQAGGWGAGVNRDGENALVCIGDGETFVTPVEVCEQRFGVLVDQFALDIVDGGAGKYRGGRGLVRDYRITADEALVTGVFGRYKFPGWGGAGGQDGSPNYVELIHADGERHIAGKVGRYKLKRGEVARLITGTGGGYGDPAERDPEAIQRDLRDGYITPEMAQRDYGVPS